MVYDLVNDTFYTLWRPLLGPLQARFDKVKRIKRVFFNYLCYLKLTSSPPWKGRGFPFQSDSCSPQLIRSYISHLRGSRVAQRTIPFIFLRIPKLDKRVSLIEKQNKKSAVCW